MPTCHKTSVLSDCLYHQVEDGYEKDDEEEEKDSDGDGEADADAGGESGERRGGTTSGAEEAGVGGKAGRRGRGVGGKTGRRGRKERLQEAAHTHTRCVRFARGVFLVCQHK